MKSLCINFGGELSTIATLKFAVLHLLLNSFALLNPIQSYHLHACQYTDMHPFAMHRFQGGKASLNWLCINFGGELSTVATLIFAVLHVLLNSFALLNPIQSYHLHARQYTYMPLFAMHCFQGCRASLKSL